MYLSTKLLKSTLILVVIMLGAYACTAAALQTASIGGMFNQFSNWLGQNWSYVALGLSEVAAILPGKFSGIIKSILVLGSKVKTNKNNH